MALERRAADVVILGSGVAGMTAALGAAAAGLQVDLLTKSGLASGSSAWAQGGVAVALGRDDAPELHAADTVAAGAGLVDPEVADLVARDGVLAVRRLIEIGAEFDRGERGELTFGREAAHSRHRILHARGDATGAELVRALAARVGAAPGLHVFDRAFGARLLTAGGRCVGLVARHADGREVAHAAARVVLATGGTGQLYRYTTNPPESTADGLLLAAAAGARLIDLEFVQFHPTALAVAADPLPLLTEALRGEGARLLDDAGERFMAAEHEAEELAPRDVVARAIWRRLAGGRRVFLDARAAVGERFPARFPSVFEACRSHGIDPRVEPMPVVPAAHYHMGGVEVDDAGRSSLAGLWACGEAASTGAHGANRLASNSLLEALVFGARVATSLGDAAGGAPPQPPAATGESVAEPRTMAPAERAELRAIAWEHVGLVRDRSGLETALARCAELWHRLPAGASEVRSLTVAGTLVAAAALHRQESRGAHFRADHPRPSERWRFRQSLTASITPAGADGEPS